jgi:predicted dehydrogenase
MKMEKIGSAILGSGFMGRVHAEAIRRLGDVEIVAIAGSASRDSKELREQFNIPSATGDWRELLGRADIQAVHICTPNALHYPMAKGFLEAGKHVLCEKPLALSSAEAKEMLDLANRHNLVHCTNHNLRYYPVVQQIRCMVESGELGEILVVQGTYSQDWLLYDTDFNWRIDAKANGPLRVMGDIGSHWMDMVQHLTGLPITALCADLQIVHKRRKSPKRAVETFAAKTAAPVDYDEVAIDTEDFGAVLVHLGDRARGAYTVSQVSAGNKNRLQMEIYGTKSGVNWNQERPDELWIGRRNEPNQIIVKDPSLLAPKAAAYADLPGGHSEGYDDTHKQVFRRFYDRIRNPSHRAEYPTFEDGWRGMVLLEKALESHRKRGWVDC